MTSVEHKTPELAGTGTPDAIEVEIIAAVTAVCETAVAEKWGERRLNKPLLVAIAQLGKRHGYFVCGPGGDRSGYLFDMAWLLYNQLDGRDRVPLVLESEWGNEDEVENDFLKLRIARAEHRVMIFRDYDIEQHFDCLAEMVLQRFAYTAAGDRYLLLGFDRATKRFKFRVLAA